MVSTVSNAAHKILIHGSHILTEAVMSIGLLSEEAQKALKKVFREQRLAHARKMNRTVTNSGVMHSLLALSDSYMNDFRQALRENAS